MAEDEVVEVEVEEAELPDNPVRNYKMTTRGMTSLKSTTTAWTLLTRMRERPSGVP